MRHLDVEELTRLSSDIYIGQVLSATANWDETHTRIFTEVHFRVQETLKGTARAGETIHVLQLGGEKDGIKMDYAGRPVFTSGEALVLFTARGKNNHLTVVGLKQGKMNIEGDEVRRDFSGLMLVESSAGGKQLRPFTPKSIRMALTELRERVTKVK
jgi:hypothetical protein